MLSVGHRSGGPNECSVGYGLSGVHVFSRCITDEAALANLYAIGPNVTNFVAFASGYMIPNYGTLNLSKLSTDTLRTVSSLQLLEKAHVGYLTANKLESFVARHQNIGLMSYAGRLRSIEIESLQRSLLTAGGVSIMLVCFARVVELSESPALHVAALKLLLRVAHCNHDFFNEFVQCNYLELIGVVLKNKKCHKDVALLTTLLEVAFDQPIVAKRGDHYRVLTTSSARIRYPGMVTFLLENFQIWIDQSEEVLDILLSVLATATRDKHPGMMYNCQRLQDASLVSALIDFCRLFPNGQSAVRDSKLEKKWSLTELFNIRQMLSNLMEEILGGPEHQDSLERRINSLPADARKLLIETGNPTIRKRLTSLLEIVMASMQLLMDGLPGSTEDCESLKPELGKLS